MDDKLKKGLMVQFPCSRGRAFVCKNIGDYVQSVAARQYCGELDEYVEQEEANTYYPNDGKKIRLIMNGWFQWRAENWPPSEFIVPLLISMHISPLKSKELLTPEGIDFLKKFGPVGCRDMWTKSLLESVGVPAYFSACLTLTLGEKYKVMSDEREGYYFVDPYFEIPSLTINKNGKERINKKIACSTFLYFLTHLFPVCKLAKKKFFKEYSPTGFLDRDTKWYRPFYKATLFYKQYKKKFDKKLLLGAEYITHWMDVDMSKDTNDDLLNIAESLVKKYAAAKLVITSRIHAGLPCLGLETPVIFISNKEVVSENGNFNTPGRLNGLIEFFRVLQFDNSVFSSEDSVLSKFDKIDGSTIFNNKTEWKPYAKELKEKCTQFMCDE